VRTIARSTRQGLQRDVNVVPMIDILLVLLIVFMLVQEGRKVIPFQLPPLSAPATPAPEFPQQIVLDLRADGSYAINGTPVDRQVLGRRLRELYLERPVKMLFVRAAPGRRYQELIEATDIAKGAGVQVIGLVPRADHGPARADSRALTARRGP
jgi:biopolymer transport protein ExbD/biopolymer transport protein TolR